jgi:hypothetical protein
MTTGSEKLYQKIPLVKIEVGKKGMKNGECKVNIVQGKLVQGELALTSACRYYEMKSREITCQNRLKSEKCKVNLHSHNPVEVLATKLKK